PQSGAAGARLLGGDDVRSARTTGHERRVGPDRPRVEHVTDLPRDAVDLRLRKPRRPPVRRVDHVAADHDNVWLRRHGSTRWRGCRSESTKAPGGRAAHYRRAMLDPVAFVVMPVSR